MTDPSLCTICAAARLPGALALVESWRRQTGAGTAMVVVADAVPGSLPEIDGVRLVAGADLGLEDFGHLAAQHEVADLERVLLPFALEAAGAPVVHLPPDAIVLAPLRPAGADVVLAARRADSAPVAMPDFVALLAPRPELLAWWQERVRERGLDEPWLDVLLARFPGVRVEQDPGWGVPAADAAGREPVWVRVDDPTALAAVPGLRDVAERRAATVCRYAEAAPPAGFIATADGLALDARLRALAARARREGALQRDVFDPAGAAAFRVWLTEPAPEPAAAGVSRIAYAIWRERPELQAAYQDLADPAERAGFFGWLVTHASPQFGVAPELLPPAPPAVEETVARPPRPPRPWGVNVAGYFQSELGVGEVARRVIEALDAVHVPVLPVQGSITPPSRRGRDFGSTGASVAPFGLNVVCVNADGLPAFAGDAGAHFFAGRRSIGFWWWEVGTFPERYHGAFDYLDEVWVGSEHVRKAIAPHATVPVVQVPVPLQVAPAPRRTRAQLGVPEGFLVLVSFDYNSVLKRKNPTGAIAAFTRAFPPGSGASLVIKSVNAHQHEDEHAQLVRAAEGHPHVHLREGYMPEVDMRALLAGADVYLSLHRSEGFGLGLAEAMALGTPVVATGYSGNLEFMDESTGWLVPYELVPIGPGAEPYPPEGSWAEPDVDAAAAALRSIRTDPEAAAARVTAARARIAERHSPAVAGAAMVRRLKLHQERLEGDGRPAPRGFETVQSLLDETRGRLGRGVAEFQRDDVGPLRRRAQGGVRRAGAPIEEARRAADRALFDVVEALERETEAATSDALVLYAGALARARRAEGRITALERAVGELEPARVRAQLDELTRAAHGIPYMEGDPYELYEHPVAGQVLGFRGGGAPVEEADAYRYFEDVFRGTEDRIKGILAPYVDLLRDAAPVLDVGCGRGELLELLGAAGIEARGVDADAGMAARAQARGLDVTVADGVAHLREQPDASLGGVVSIQVIEHLPPPVLEELVVVARHKLRPGGLFVAETVNPHAAHALKTFWVDLTHQHPLFPEVVLTLVRGAGYREGFICHLAGMRRIEQDRFNESSYAVVATA